MSVGDTLNGLAAKISDLYREIVTTSVRFDELQRNTDKILTKVEAVVEQLVVKVASIHDQHVREKAALEAQIAVLQGRLTALSEQALHSVARDVVREIVADAVRDSLRNGKLLLQSTKEENAKEGA